MIVNLIHGMHHEYGINDRRHFSIKFHLKISYSTNTYLLSFQVLSALDILQPPHLDFFQEMYPFQNTNYLHIVIQTTRK